MARYKINLRLENEARLEMILFSTKEHRWIFRHHYTSPVKERGEKPEIVNDTTLAVNYDKGIAEGINLFMNIVFPHRRGQTYWAGLDISKNSLVGVEFKYEKQGRLFRMIQADAGIYGKLELDKLQAGLMKPVEFPFPLKDKVELEGEYRVPFLKNDGEIAFFSFPENYKEIA